MLPAPEEIQSLPAPLDRIGAPQASGWARVVSWLGRGSLAVLDQGLVSGSNFLISIMFARWMSPSDYGHFAVAFAVFLLGVSSYQAVFQIPMMVIGPRLRDEERKAYVVGLIRFIDHLAPTLLAMGLGVSAVLQYFASPWVGAALGAAFVLPAVVQHWQTRDFHYMALSPKAPAQAAVIYFVIIAIGLVFLSRMKFALVFAGFCLMAIAALASAAWLRLCLPASVRQSGEYWSASQILRRSWPLGRWELLINLAVWIPTQAVLPVIASVLGAGQAGAMKALQNFATPLSQVYSSLNRLIQPALSMEVAKGLGGRAAQRRIGNIGLIALACGLAYATFFGILSRSLVELLYHSATYSGLYWLVFWSVLPTVMWGTAHCVSVGLRASGRFRPVMLAFLAGAAITMLSVEPLAAAYALPGAVAAVTFGNLLTLLAVVVFVWKDGLPLQSTQSTLR